MAIEVVVLPRGGTEPFVRLRWRESDQFRIDEDRWAECALELTRQSAAGNTSPAEVFLCLLGDHLTSRYDHWYFEKLLGTAHRYSWGAKVYVAVGNDIRVQEQHLSTDAPSLARWYESVLDNEAAAVVEVPFDSEGIVPLEASELRKAADADAERQQVFPSLVGAGRWGFLTDPGSRLPQFLYPVRGGSAAGARGGRYMVIIEKSETANPVASVLSAVSKQAGGRYAVAALTVWPTAELRDYCEQNGFPLLWFRGPFELRYYLARLNALSQAGGALAWGKVESVHARLPRVFHAQARGRPAVLLVTSAFDPQSEPAQVLKAAQELSIVNRNLPRDAAVEVQRLIGHGGLPGVLSSLDVLTVWLHLGHGKGEHGLQDYSTGAFLPPEKWLDCFSAHGASGRGLALAFFSACRSTHIARRFAAAGAGVAIGFEQDVPPDATRLLAASVIHEALESGGERDKILKAFSAGCSQLAAGGFIDTGPTAYYSD